jgi:hypothetical protein
MEETSQKEIRIRIEGPKAPSPAKQAKQPEKMLSPEPPPRPEKRSLSWFYKLLLLLTFGCLGGSAYVLSLAFSSELKDLLSQIKF